MNLATEQDYIERINTLLGMVDRAINLSTEGPLVPAAPAPSVEPLSREAEPAQLPGLQPAPAAIEYMTCVKDALEAADELARVISAERRKHGDGLVHAGEGPVSDALTELQAVLRNVRRLDDLL